MDFTDQVALVTGCASGIGLATTELLLSLHAQVLGLDITPTQLQHPAFTFRQCNIASSQEITDAVKQCLDQHNGRIDVLANVAGIMDGFASAQTVTDAQWQRILDVNLTACMHLSRAVLPAMQEARRGVIVNVASRAGLGGGAAGVAYTASKHALIGMTKNTAWRFHDVGIRCNAVCPGNTQSNIANSMRPEEFDKESFDIMSPILDIHRPPGQLGSVIMASDVANAIVFLASDMATKINGAVIPVDNAWSAI